MFATWIVLAVLVEAITQYIKDIFNGFNPDKLMALIVSLLVAFGAGVDVFEMVGIDFIVPYVGMIFAAIIMSRGANAVHDIWDKIVK